MAKYERPLTGDFDRVLTYLHDGILEGSASASYEDGSDYAAGEIRCAVGEWEGSVSYCHYLRRKPGRII